MTSTTRSRPRYASTVLPLSTHERMVGFLIEHFAGDFPLWLAPEQVRIVPIADRHNDYAYALKDRFFEVEPTR